MKKYTSSYLKQNTSEVLRDTAISDEPSFIYTHNKPKAVLVSVDLWEKYMRELGDSGSEDNSRLQIVRDYHKKAMKKGAKFKEFDSANYIRKTRDNG